MHRLLFAMVAVIVVGLGLFAWRHREQDELHQLQVFGNLEVTEVDLSFKIPGKMIERYVDEGDTIVLGQKVACLDTKEAVDQVGIKQAEWKSSLAALLELEEGELPRQVVELEASKEEASAEWKRAEDEWKRQKTLLDDQVISQKEYDQSYTSYLVAKARAEQTKASLDFLKEVIMEEKVKQARAKVQGSSKDLSLAQTKYEDSFLSSSLSGWVLTKNVEPGEVVAAGTPVVTVADLKDIWFRGYVVETDIGKVKLGLKATVTVDAYPGKTFPGKITFISKEAEFTPKTVETKKERVQLVYRIKINLENLDNDLKPGMPAEGLIELSS